MLMFANLKKNLKGFKPTLFEILLGSTALIIIIAVFFLLFRTSKKLNVTIKVNEESVIWPNQGVSAWFADLFYVGMGEKNSFGKTMAKVTKVRSYNSDPSKKTLYLTVNLDAVYSPGISQYSYKGKNILIGSTLQLYLDKIFIEGLIVDVEGFKEPYPTQKLMVDAQVMDINPVFPETYGVIPFIPDNINEGDVVRDNQGKVALQIVKKRVVDASKTIITADGNIISATDPIRKDVYLTLEILASRIGNRYYLFGDLPILVGLGLPIHLDKISIFPTVTKITEVK